MEEEEKKALNKKKKVARLDLKADEGLELSLLGLFSPPLLQRLVTVWCLKRQQSGSFISLHIPYLNPPIPPPSPPPPPRHPSQTLPPPSDCFSVVPLSCFPPQMSKHGGLLDHGET